MNRIQELFLLKQQTTPLTTLAAAMSASLTGTDVLEVLKESKMDFDFDEEPVELVAGSTFEQDAAVIGAEKGSGTLSIPLSDFHGTGVSKAPPYWGKALAILAGFAQTDITAGPEGYSYAPTGTWLGGLLRHYTGPQMVSGSSLAHLYYNLIATWDIDIAANKYAKLNLTLGGAYGGESILTQPAVTKMRAVSPAIKGATISIFSNAFQLLTAKITGTQTLAHRENLAETNGMGGSDITDRKIKVALKFYADPAITNIANHPAQIARAGTSAAFSINWGASSLTTPTFSIAGGAMQFTKPKLSDEGGVITFDVEGQFNANDITLFVTRIKPS